MSRAPMTIAEMAQRYDALEKVFAGFSDKDPRVPPMLDEFTELENRIVATPATSREELAAKQRFIRKTKFVTQEDCGETGDIGELVSMILRLDAERIAAER
jgi:hypothetical protein